VLKLAIVLLTSVFMGMNVPLSLKGPPNCTSGCDFSLVASTACSQIGVTLSFAPGTHAGTCVCDPVCTQTVSCDVDFTATFFVNAPWNGCIKTARYPGDPWGSGVTWGAHLTDCGQTSAVIVGWFADCGSTSADCSTTVTFSCTSCLGRSC